MKLAKIFTKNFNTLNKTNKTNKQNFSKKTKSHLESKTQPKNLKNFLINKNLNLGIHKKKKKNLKSINKFKNRFKKSHPSKKKSFFFFKNYKKIYKPIYLFYKKNILKKKNNKYNQTFIKFSHTVINSSIFNLKTQKNNTQLHIIKFLQPTDAKKSTITNLASNLSYNSSL
jgi:hypothetical protein